jgi:hypothetical protein
MTPNEVKGLHAIAAATGQQITTNPETGLPEAFSLEGFLPMLAGAALAPFTGGMSAALLVGGGYGLATGSLEQGLVAGLGAFGGHGLATGLMGAGGAAAANAATPTAATTVAPTATTTATTTATPTLAAPNLAVNPTPLSTAATPTAAPNLATLPGGAQGTTAALDVSKQGIVGNYGANLSGTTAPGMTAAPNTGTLANLQAGSPGSTSYLDAAKQRAISGGNMPNPAAADVSGTAAKESISRPLTDRFNDLTAKGSEGYSRMGKGLETVTDSTDAAAEFLSKNKLASASAVAPAVLGLGEDDDEEDKPPPTHPGMIRPYEFERTDNPEAYAQQTYDPNYTGERLYFTETFTELPAYEAPGPEYKKAAKGGIMQLYGGGSTNTGKSGRAKEEEKKPDPHGEEVVMAFRKPSNYAYSYDPNSQSFVQTGGPGIDATDGSTGAAPTPAEPIGGIASLPAGPSPVSPNKPLMQPVNVPAYQSPEQRLGLNPFYAHARGELDARYAPPAEGMARGGLSHLGGYSDGGRMLKGPGDGMSDDIPASISGKQPARLADGEFVVPADVVSHLGNGSTDAGAKKLYKMMAAVRKARTGNSKQGKQIKAEKYLPKR